MEAMLNQEHELAVKFATMIQETLNAEQIAEVNRRNGTQQYAGVCASHDFCDPNQAMLDAMEELGIEFDPQDEQQTRLTDGAWTLAKAAGFDAEQIGK